MQKKYYIITPNTLVTLDITTLELQRQKEAEDFTVHVKLSNKEPLPTCIADAWNIN